MYVCTYVLPQRRVKCTLRVPIFVASWVPLLRQSPTRTSECPFHPTCNPHFSLLSQCPLSPLPCLLHCSLQKVPLPCWALQVDAAARYSCALGDDGNLYFWGKSVFFFLSRHVSVPFPVRALTYLRTLPLFCRAPCAPDKVLFSSPTILNPTDTTVEQFCCGTHFLLFGVREGRC